MQPLKDLPELGLVGPCSNSVSGPQQIPVTYKDLSELDAFADARAARFSKKLQRVERLVGFCLLMRREVIEKIGLFDERFGIGNFEDDDLCRRALAAGYRMAIVKEAFVHHFGSVTLKSQGIDLGALLKKNQALFNEKWGISRAKIPAIVGSPRVSLCMIVRDSARTIGDCLSSIRPWVDEMIVVDTGSTDNTREIVRSLGAKVFEFPWCDSFATARNESLRHATGDWLFWMDADDTIGEVNGRKLRELIDQPSPTAMGYVMQVHCPPDTVVDHVKIFRNLPELRFTGRIHEQILPAIRRLGGDVQWTDIFVTHSGSDVTPAGKARKQKRDWRLLEMELADDPDKTFTLFNVGMTQLDMGKAAEALNSLARSLQLAEAGESHVRKVYALLVQAYTELGRMETAMKTCVRGLAVCPRDPELMFRRGTLLRSLGRLPEAEKSLRELLEMTPDRHFSSFDHGILGAKGWQNLAVVYQMQQKHGLAADAWRRVLETDSENISAWRGLLTALVQAKDISAMEKLAQGAIAPEIRTICEARLLAARGDVVGAATILERGLDHQESLDLLEELCELTFTTDQLEKAERWLGELARRPPENPAVHQNLGIIHLRRKSFLKAAEHARRSLELRPNHPPAMDLLDKATRGAV
jgi:GT2 family glycosyltransferase/tetratricopeptide (TPR) repeat protein